MKNSKISTALKDIMLTVKKEGKAIVSGFLIACMLLCSTVPASAVASSLRMNVSSVTIQPGGTYQLTAIVTPSGTNARLVWSSDNTGVATVNQNGVVSGKSAGTATITCKATDGSGLTASCVVTVAKMIADITLSASSVTIYTGASQTVTAAITPSDATTKELSWSSSNASVATVNNGVITGKSAGTAVVTCIAKDGSKKSAKCTVTVKQGVTAISLNRTGATVGVGNTIQLTATVSPDNASNKSVTWTSANPSIASVSSTGQVKGVGTGSTTITCQSNDGTGVKAHCTVTVSAVSNGGTDSKPVSSQPQTPSNQPSKPQQSASANTTSERAHDGSASTTEEYTEPERETVTFSDEEFQEVVEEVFGPDNNESNDKYAIDELLKVAVEQEKRNTPIVISWNEVQGFSGYEVYVAVGEKNAEAFQESDYILVAAGEQNFLNIFSYQYKKKYSIKVRAYLTNEETGERQYSEFSTPLEIVSKKQSLSDKIKQFFAKKM